MPLVHRMYKSTSSYSTNCYAEPLFWSRKHLNLQIWRPPWTSRKERSEDIQSEWKPMCKWMSSGLPEQPIHNSRSQGKRKQRNLSQEFKALFFFWEKNWDWVPESFGQCPLFRSCHSAHRMSSRWHENKYSWRICGDFGGEINYAALYYIFFYKDS